MIYFDKTLTVDCGINTGWAYWKGDDKPLTGEFTVQSKYLKDHFEYRNKLCNQFKTLLRSKFLILKRVYLEGTQSYESNIGITALRKGTLFELSYLVGRYEQCCAEDCIYYCNCKIINAPEWKGQMTKEMTADKIKIINGLTYSSEHITDAVGMGFGLVGAFDWTVRKK